MERTKTNLLSISRLSVPSPLHSPRRRRRLPPPKGDALRPRVPFLILLDPPSASTSRPSRADHDRRATKFLTTLEPAHKQASKQHLLLPVDIRDCAHAQKASCVPVCVNKGPPPMNLYPPEARVQLYSLCLV